MNIVTRIARLLLRLAVPPAILCVFCAAADRAEPAAAPSAQEVSTSAFSSRDGGTRESALETRANFKYHFKSGDDALPVSFDTDAGAPQFGGDGWRCLEEGLCYGEFSEGEGGAISAVRLDPAHFDLVLCSAGMDGGGAHTLAEWGQKYGLAAAVNASMYLKDGLTSTGYMREGDYINNGRVVGRLGAFLVSGPDAADLPRATIVDKDMPDWEELLKRYRMVVQNYRIVNSQRRILWAPGGPLYSISAIALDGEGHILFLHSRERVEAYTFAQRLLHLPLDIRTVMYVEGGGQAGLFVRSGSMVKELQGQSMMDFLVTGYLSVRLPNVIGARRHRE